MAPVNLPLIAALAQTPSPVPLLQISSIANRIPLLSSSLANSNSVPSGSSGLVVSSHTNRRTRRSYSAPPRNPKGKARFELDVFPNASPPTPHTTSSLEVSSSSEDRDIDELGNFIKELLARRKTERAASKALGEYSGI